MTAIHKTGVVLLLSALAILPAQGQGWRRGAGANAAGAADAMSVEEVVERCCRSGMATNDSARLQTMVAAAQADSLPVGSVLDKIEEGLAKKADPVLIAKAVETRVHCLYRASLLLADAPQGRHAVQERLLSRIALLLEDGLPEEVLKQAFSRAGGPRYGRISYVLDAGEALHLAGVEPEQTQLIMTDCIDRNLSRPEIARALDYLLVEQAKGRDFQSIYQELWIKPE